MYPSCAHQRCSFQNHIVEHFEQCPKSAIPARWFWCFWLFLLVRIFRTIFFKIFFQVRFSTRLESFVLARWTDFGDHPKSVGWARWHFSTVMFDMCFSKHFSGAHRMVTKKHWNLFKKGFVMCQILYTVFLRIVRPQSGIWPERLFLGFGFD